MLAWIAYFQKLSTKKTDEEMKTLLRSVSEHMKDISGMQTWDIQASCEISGQAIRIPTFMLEKLLKE